MQELDDRYPEILAEHRRLVRGAVSLHDGVEVNTEGDSFFLAFRTAHDAVSGVAQMQRSLADHDWPPDGVVRLRIGVHTGQGLVEANDYIGIDVHRASRIADTGYGGQVILSESTAVALGPRLPDGLELLDLGKHRLKDLTEPETLFQLNIQGLGSEFPPLRTLEANNLPVQLTSFVGREEVMAQALELLGENRILTLTGSGGTGKTRLSLQVAAELSASFDDGVYFIPLAPVSEPALVASAVLDALGLASSSAKETPDEFLASQLADRATLLIMDNFEHVVESAPLVSRLAQVSPASKFLVTSRVPLEIAGEQEMPVPPLKTSSTDPTGDISKLMQVERVRLFVERAVSVRPEFELTDNAAAVVRLVDRLDGLPLAIELVASQVKLLSVDMILERLDLKTLGSGRRDVPERQATLWGAIEWSYRLLDESARQLLSRLSVFAGRARLDEIEQVCAPGLDADLLSLLSRLAGHSLIHSRTEHDARFSMLHVIREFATERLEESGEAKEVRRAHAITYAALAERAQPALIGHDRKHWLDRLADDVDNFRVALTWVIDNEETDLASKLAFNTWRFWQGNGYLYEAESRMSQILALPVETPFWRAKAMEAAGGIAWWRGMYEKSREMYRRMLEIHRQGDNLAEIANALYNLGLATPDFMGGGMAEDFRRDRADPEATAEAHRLLREAEELYQELGDVGGLADVIWGRGNLKLLEDDHDGHLENSLRAAELYRQVGNVFGWGWAFFEVGWAHRELGNLEDAWSYLSQALEQFAEQEDVPAVVLHLSALSSLAKEQADMKRAVTLAGAMHQLRLKSGPDIAAIEINLVKGLEYETLEQQLTGDLADAYRLGKSMDMPEAVAFALSGK